MLFKIISFSLISYLCLQNNLIVLDKIFYKIENSVSTQALDNSNYGYELVAALPDKNIKLFGLSSQANDIYDEFLLSVNGKTANFKWKSEKSITFSPKLILSDINYDNIEELIIIMTTGTGSDFHTEDIHIINLNTLNKYNVADPLSIIKEHVTTKITEKKTDMLIEIKLNDNKFNIKKDKTYAGTWFENIHFGYNIHWDVVNNKLYAYIGAQVSPAGYIGIIAIEYKFENNRFSLDNIYFKESN